MREKHGESKTRLYKIWENMKRRCYNEKYQYYYNYGGRGIIVCEEWKNSYKSFRDWALSSGYKDNLTIDRKENDKDYTPDNCRWLSKNENNLNKRNSKFVQYKEQKILLSELVKKLNVDYGKVNSRLNSGYTIEQAIDFSLKSKKYVKHTIDNITLSLRGWANKIGISYSSLRSRIKHNVGIFDKSCLKLRNDKYITKEYRLSV